MIQQRILSIVLGAVSGSALVLLVSRGRLSWTSAVVGAALVAVAEYAVGDVRSARVAAPAATTNMQPSANDARTHAEPETSEPKHQPTGPQAAVPQPPYAPEPEHQPTDPKPTYTQDPQHLAAPEPSTMAPGWHEAAMTSLPVPDAVTHAKPVFTRPPLQVYRSDEPRTAQQCPTCSSHTISNTGTNFQCHQCAAMWTWHTGDHWPDVRPQPNLQEVAHVSETS